MNQTSEFGKINDKPLEHHVNGTIFKAERCDLRGGVTVNKPLDKIPASDMFVFGAWHALQIHSDLNGFGGYDAVQFTHVPDVELTMDNIGRLMANSYVGCDILSVFAERSGGWICAFAQLKSNTSAFLNIVRNMHKIAIEKKTRVLLIDCGSSCIAVVPSVNTIDDVETLYAHLINSYKSNPKLRAATDAVLVKYNKHLEVN